MNPIPDGFDNVRVILMLFASGFLGWFIGWCMARARCEVRGCSCESKRRSA